MSRKQQLYKCSNTIREFSKLLSDRLWSIDDDEIKDIFMLSALADSINLAAIEIDDLVSCLSEPDDNDPSSPDQDSGVISVEVKP